MDDADRDEIGLNDTFLINGTEYVCEYDMHVILNLS